MIHLNQITKRYGSHVLFENASLQILSHSRIGLVGANGSGKSTIFRLLVGEESPDEGELNMSKQTVIGHFSQETGEMSGRSALAETMAVCEDVTELGVQIKEMEDAMGQPMDDDAMTELLERYGEAMEQFENRGGYDLEFRAQTILTGLGIGPDKYNRPVESFSGGWKMRIALARILLLNPDVLLLDEPTNHLDVESIIWLEEWLANDYEGALVMTSHDREFMNRVVKTIVEISNQAVTTYGGNYDFYIKEREIRRSNLIAQYQRQQDSLAKDEAFIARFKARASHAAQVQSRIKKIEKIERIVLPQEPHVIRFSFDPPPRSGDEVIKFNDLTKIWPNPEGGETRVFEGVSGLIRREEKIAIVGVNGAGKSTFLKVLAKQTEATSGDIVIGANVHMGYFSQHSMELLDPNKTIYETIQDAMPDASVGTVRKLCASFLFQGDDVDKRISILSGGEKSRVVIASLLARPLNLLVLDEPTNHLDIQSREVLLDALKGFTGTVLIVSHDRHFLRALANRVIAISQNEIINYDGDYDYYLYKSDAMAKADEA
jgi:ATP-binding cassette subfamily F protein 3